MYLSFLLACLYRTLHPLGKLTRRVGSPGQPTLHFTQLRSHLKNQYLQSCDRARRRRRTGYIYATMSPNVTVTKSQTITERDCDRLRRASKSAANLYYRRQKPCFCFSTAQIFLFFDAALSMHNCLLTLTPREAGLRGRVDEKLAYFE